MAIFSSGLAASANGLKNIKQGHGHDWGDGRSGGYSGNQRPSGLVLEAYDARGTAKNEAVAQSGKPSIIDRQDQDRDRRGISSIGAGMMGAGAAMMNRFGSVARFIGHAVVEGSGDGSGLEYRALTAFAPIGSTRPSTNQTNRSSLQARRYLDEF